MTAAEAEPTRVGELLAGRYTLMQRLGGGGVGEVYRARDERLKREVAVKLLRREYNRSREVVQRLLREAQVTDQVRHPNVLEVFDVDVDPSGVPFIVQELLRGEDLSVHIARQGGRIPVEAALAFMIPVCDAVATAHAVGVVHRDLKPENVFLMHTASTVIPKVLDFGLARVLLAPGQQRLTATGLTMGTPYFMSPEQVQGDRNLDARCDVWALGVMLYEMLTGALPFTGDSEGAIYVKVCTVEPTPVEMLAPWIPPDLARVVGRCLRKDIARRYPSASGVLRDLTHIQRREAVETTLSGSPVSTQLMRVVPVSLPNPEPSAPMPRASETPPVSWSPAAAPPLPITRPGAKPSDGSKTWVIVVVVALVLLLIGVGLGVLYLLSNDERADPRTTQHTTPATTIPSAPVGPSQATPAVPSGAPDSAVRAEPPMPVMPPSPVAPVAPTAPVANAGPHAHSDNGLPPKPRGVHAPGGGDPTLLRPDPPSENNTVSSGTIENPARQANHVGLPNPFGGE